MDRDQQFLLPVDMREWLPASDPVFTVIDVVTALDTSAVHAVRRTGGVGRAGYDPDMLLTVLVFGWAQGQRSSRVLERLCQRDAAFRIICAGNTPDHVTISRFRADVAPYMDALFTQVLLLCGQLGLARLGVVALDGVKISSDASLSANRTEKGLRAAAAEAAEQRLREHARAAA
ncbi:transposase, partial [Rhodococcus sp. IEGM 1341]|uniref:transposase n=1 Tax=Rhodococcus sp. IEGM 1341 TaxID=3047090 RepID=UPI0024B70D99